MDLHDRSIVELQALMTDGATSAEALVRSYLERIDAIDRAGPTLRAVLETNPDALAIAADLDAERRRSGARGPLHGVPVLLKDNVDTGDALTTTAGSLALEGHRAERDAFLVARLREAGAIVLGKANLSEWANFRSTRSSSGWSSRGGQIRNPYALDRTPGGSSAGSAVAVAAGLCAAAIGTETDGSITAPATLNGVVGFKPTVGLVSRDGIVPISASQDTAGPLTRTVADAALVLDAIAGVDPNDPATASARMPAAFAALGARADLRGVRLGVPRACVGVHEAADAVAARAFEVLRGLGAEIVEGIELGDRAALAEAERTVLLAEFKAGLNTYLRDHPTAPVRDLDEVVAFNRRHADRVMPYFGQELHEAAQRAPGLDDPAYLEARATCQRLARDEGIDRALREHALDALIAPTRVPAWTIDLIDGDRPFPGCSSPAAVAGYPHVSVPAGFAHGLPIGLSIFAGAFADADVLAIAAAFERARGPWPAPTFPDRVV
ncbi:MAG: amidase [Trueperaceae bacterium]